VSEHVVQMRDKSVARKPDFPNLTSLFHLIPGLHSNASRLHVIEMTVIAIAMVDDDEIAIGSLVLLSLRQVGIHNLLIFITVIRDVVAGSHNATVSRGINRDSITVPVLLFIRSVVVHLAGGIHWTEIIGVTI